MCTVVVLGAEAEGANLARRRRRSNRLKSRVGLARAGLASSRGEVWCRLAAWFRFEGVEELQVVKPPHREARALGQEQCLGTGEGYIRI